MEFFESFELSQITVPVNQITGITLRSRFGRIARAGSLQLEFIHYRGVAADGTIPWVTEFEKIPLKHLNDETGAITFSVNPATEGEMHFRLFDSSKNLLICEWSIYALEDDLYYLNPYRGDLHVHSRYSACASPIQEVELSAAYWRQAGCDFFTVTDHMQYKPSLIAEKFVKECGSSMLVIPGEEVHLFNGEPVPPPHVPREQLLLPVHICSLGASQGIIDYMIDHRSEFAAFMEKRCAELPQHLSYDLRYNMAGADWIFDRIKKSGGFASFCHPFWKPSWRLGMPDEVREYILAGNQYDAIEIFNDNIEQEMISLAWWQAECIKRGRFIPVIGATDAHSAPGAKRFTVAFSSELSVRSILDAVRNSSAVACDFTAGKMIIGDPRLVKYTYFLEREYFPMHDALCMSEGLQMRLKYEKLQPEKVSDSILRGR